MVDPFFAYACARMSTRMLIRSAGMMQLEACNEKQQTWKRSAENQCIFYPCPRDVMLDPFFVYASACMSTPMLTRIARMMQLEACKQKQQGWKRSAENQYVFYPWPRDVMLDPLFSL